jgi:hypothetical protein
MKRELYESIDKTWERFSLNEAKDGTIIWDTIESIANGSKPKYLFTGTKDPDKFTQAEMDDQVVQAVMKKVDKAKASFLVDFFNAYKGTKIPGQGVNKSFSAVKSWTLASIQGNYKWAKSYVADAKKYYNATAKYSKLW